MTPEKLATWMIENYSINLDNLLVAQAFGNMVVLHIKSLPVAVEREVYEEILKQLIEKEGLTEH